MTAPQDELRVLVIEDDEPVARTFVRGIERAGMQAAWADTGALGVTMYADAWPRPWMDVTWP